MVAMARRLVSTRQGRFGVTCSISATRSLSSASSSTPPLVGSAPEYPRHLILHGPQQSKNWPSHLESVSQLYRELGTRWSRHPQLKKLGFGLSDAATRQPGAAAQQWDSTRPRFEDPPADAVEESYQATIYPDFTTVPIPLSLSTISAFEEYYLALPPPKSLPPTLSSPKPRAHIYVCTHGARDCRCADIGEPLYQALVKEARRRKLGGEMGDPSTEEGVLIARVGHLGQHKYAGNALVYREDGRSDWYGLLRDTDAGELLDHAVSQGSSPWWARWRGQLGLSSAEVEEAYLAGTTGESAPKKRKEVARNALGDPVQLIFKSWDNVDEYKVTGYEGESLMETARRHDLPSILATCGGHCECATCHVHVVSAQPVAPSPSESGRALAAIPVNAPLPEMTDEEDEQLEFAMGAKDDSRLACQLPVTKELGEWIKRGGRIQLPRY